MFSISTFEITDKLVEEINELRYAINSANKQNIEEELGDVFFALINYSRFLDKILFRKLILA